MNKEILHKATSIIKKFEGFKPQAYQDQGGVWTVGYGFTGPNIGPGYTITMPQADKLLEDRIGQLYEQIKHLVHIELTNNQFAALISFVFNVGIGNFRSSTMLVDLNNKAVGSAQVEFLKWNHLKGVVVPGLTRRREAELELFKSTL